MRDAVILLSVLIPLAVFFRFLLRPSMWKHRYILLPALLFPLGVLILGLHFLPYGNGVTRENYQRIKVGMTEAEVRAILGKPWDDSLLDPEGPNYGHASMHVYGLVRPSAHLPALLKQVTWMGDNLSVDVSFGVDGRVCQSVLNDAYQIWVGDDETGRMIDRPRTSLTDRVKRRLRARLGLPAPFPTPPTPPTTPSPSIE
jgi:hypothetical protein